MISLFLFVIGTAMGSFANAVVWRLHQNRNFITERSECEYCHHPLAPKDLVPVLSWLLLRGRCRYCHLKLSVQHPAVELATGLLFAASYWWWPDGLKATGDIIGFIFWLVFIVGMVMLFLYDLRWQLLPNKIIFPLISLAALDIGVRKVWLDNEGLAAVVTAGAGVVVVAGFFGLLYFVSKGRWIGFGDVKLGIFMGLVLGMPMALFALMGSYYIAAAIILPLFIAGVVDRKSKVPFGPFLLVSMVLVFFFSNVIDNWIATIL